MLFSFQDKSRSVLVSDDASATTLLLILIRDDDDDEFKFVRGLNIFSQRFFAATTTTREQQKRGVVLIIDFSDEEETEEEEIMVLLFMMMMPCALYRYIHRERESAKLFFPLERSKSRSRALTNGERCATLSFLLSVCLRANKKRQNFFVSSVVFVRSRVFSERFLREGWCFGHHGKQKKLQREREREKEREGESAPQERQTQTQKDGERRRKKTESRILGREDDIVRDDDDSDDERISSSPPGKISRGEEEEMEQKERANDGGARHGRENPVRGEKHVHHPARRKRCETGGN